MRCPHCAAAIPDGAAFCGVCGRRVTPGRPTGELPAAGEPSGGSMSLFELPVARSARVARIIAVLLLDAVLAGSGIAMGLSWWSSRHAVAAPQPPAEPKTAAEAAAPPEAPDQVPEVVTEEPRRVAGTGDGQPAAGDGQRDPRPPDRGRRPEPGGGAIVPPVWPGSTKPDAAPVVAPAPDAAPAAPAAPVPAPDAAAAEPVDDEDAPVSSEAVRNVVHSHMTDVKRCYSRAAKVGTSTEPIEGKVEIQFTIRTTGDAEDVRVVENTTGSEQLGTCVAALLSSWRFPSPGEDVEFVWPFVFKAPTEK